MSERTDLVILSVQDIVISCSPCRTPSHVWTGPRHRTGTVPSPDSILVRRWLRCFLMRCLLLCTVKTHSTRFYFILYSIHLCWIPNLISQRWNMSFLNNAQLFQIWSCPSAVKKSRVDKIKITPVLHFTFIWSVAVSSLHNDRCSQLLIIGVTRCKKSLKVIIYFNKVTTLCWFIICLVKERIHSDSFKRLSPIH